MTEPVFVSIVIATYRRPDMVRDTVVSLTKMRCPPRVPLEVIIVDNDPDGSARSVTKQLEALCHAGFSVRYVHEPRTGLSHARNRGIEESRGDMICFLDDDLFVGQDWLANILDCFERTGADCVGGRTLVHWEGEPEPVVRACEKRIIALDLGDRDFEVRGTRLPGGGNAVVRRVVFDRGLRFSTALGRVGNVLLSSEDTEFFLRLRRAGGRIWYCAGGVVHHRTGGERLTGQYLIKRNYWFGISFAVIDRRLHGLPRQRCLALARLAKLVFVAVPALVVATLRRNRPDELLARCALSKQLGYLRATIRPIKPEALRQAGASPAPPAACVGN